eukprot:363681-Chlamydomonas_euryale.AAC.2
MSPRGVCRRRRRLRVHRLVLVLHALTRAAGGGHQRGPAAARPSDDAAIVAVTAGPTAHLRRLDRHCAPVPPPPEPPEPPEPSHSQSSSEHPHPQHAQALAAAAAAARSGARGADARASPQQRCQHQPSPVSAVRPHLDRLLTASRVRPGRRARARRGRAARALRVPAAALAHNADAAAANRLDACAASGGTAARASARA